jgi:hypothetical protein
MTWREFLIDVGGPRHPGPNPARTPDEHRFIDGRRLTNYGEFAQIVSTSSWVMGLLSIYSAWDRPGISGWYLAGLGVLLVLGGFIVQHELDNREPPA